MLCRMRCLSHLRSVLCCVPKPPGISGDPGPGIEPVCLRSLGRIAMEGEPPYVGEGAFSSASRSPARSAA
jgi:hypothetical protein